MQLLRGFSRVLSHPHLVRNYQHHHVLRSTVFLSPTRTTTRGVSAARGFASLVDPSDTLGPTKEEEGEGKEGEEEDLQEEDDYDDDPRDNEPTLGQLMRDPKFRKAEKAAAAEFGEFALELEQYLGAHGVETGRFGEPYKQLPQNERMHGHDPGEPPWDPDVGGEINDPDEDPADEPPTPILSAREIQEIQEQDPAEKKQDEAFNPEATRKGRPPPPRGATRLSAAFLLNVQSRPIAPVDDGSGQWTPKRAAEFAKQKELHARARLEPLAYVEPEVDQAVTVPKLDDFETAVRKMKKKDWLTLDTEPFDWYHLQRELEEHVLAKYYRILRKASLLKIGIRKNAPVPEPRVVKIDERNRAHGTGRRKTAVADTYIMPGSGLCFVNGMRHAQYFSSHLDRVQFFLPFLSTNTVMQFDVHATIQGGGSSAQAKALKLGVARALQNWNPTLRAVLKKDGLLRRDERIVERKHIGKRKARRSFQWVKR